MSTCHRSDFSTIDGMVRLAQWKLWNRGKDLLVGFLGLYCVGFKSQGCQECGAVLAKDLSALHHEKTFLFEIMAHNMHNVLYRQRAQPST
eukprot:4604259-Amphidinium_carterae.1